MFENINIMQESEVKPAINRLIKARAFSLMIKGISRDLPKEKLIKIFDNISTIKDFQTKFIKPLLDTIIFKTTNGLSYDGVNNLDPSQAYLFISNHRDIILDSTFLNYILLNNSHETTQLAIGDNLLIYPWITDFLRLNKSFIVKRDMSPRQLYTYSKKLSEYIHNTITNEKVSIWIAQREGRAKDGHDETQTGVLKMLSMGNKTNFVDHFKSLQIVPVSISYEFDPCDNIKIKELYQKKTGGEYSKTTKDDLKSMITGITGQKGRVHYSIGKPINKELNDFQTFPNLNTFVKNLALLLDHEIQSNYKLWSTNYLAHDMLNNTSMYTDKYNDKDKKSFQELIAERIKGIDGKKTVLETILLEMYSNPVKNRLKRS